MSETNKINKTTTGKTQKKFGYNSRSHSIRFGTIIQFGNVKNWQHQLSSKNGRLLSSYDNSINLQSTDQDKKRTNAHGKRTEK